MQREREKERNTNKERYWEGEREGGERDGEREERERREWGIGREKRYRGDRVPDVRS